MRTPARPEDEAADREQSEAVRACKSAADAAIEAARENLTRSGKVRVRPRNGTSREKTGTIAPDATTREGAA